MQNLATHLLHCGKHLAIVRLLVLGHVAQLSISALRSEGRQGFLE